MNITSLPDGALHHISSFLSTPEKALFCISVSSVRGAIKEVLFNSSSPVEILDFVM
jgi:hypothetical protein